LQHIIIKFLINEDIKSIEILTRFQAQFGDGILVSRIQIFDWVKKFRSGRDAVENESYERRPRSSVTDENIRLCPNAY